ncbi:hypothetical protein KKE92_03930 [Candidatus Micrarchaeota archaeon]|nr:hypothetical protein [Candidatus Micrarchaeota archaeon]
MSEESQCFVCSKSITDAYYVNGIPLCSTCSTQKSAESEKRYCVRCNASSFNSIILYTQYGLLCSSCRAEARLIEKPNESVQIRRLVNGAIVKFYKSGREDDYYEEYSSLPAVQTLIHIALIVLLSVLSVFSGNIFLLIFDVLLDIFLIFLLVSFVWIRIKIYDNEIRCLYGPFTYSINKCDLDQVEIIKPHNYLAYGLSIRRNKYGWLLKFLRGPGPGILIKKKSGFFRSVFISSSDPVNLLQNIAKKLC